MSIAMSRRAFLSSGIALGGASLLSGFPSPAIAQSRTRLRMILNWRYQGPQSMFFIAQDKGYFAEHGLEVEIDQGSGSGAAVGQVAGGAYDVGFGDVNALIQLAAQNPDEAPVCVYQMFNQPPFTIAVMSDSDITTPADLEGRTIGGPANDGALKLFPAFADISGIDESSVEILNMDPTLREQMLRSRQVDAVFGFVNTIRFSAMLTGMNPDEDIRFINYGDYGMDLYSNGVLVPKAMARDRPEAVRGIVAAINRGIADTFADMEGSIDFVAEREPLINRDVEYQRLVATVRDEMGHPEIAEGGLGNIDPERMRKAIEIVVEANGLPRTPALEEIFDGSFLPPENERITSIA